MRGPTKRSFGDKGVPKQELGNEGVPKQELGHEGVRGNEGVLWEEVGADAGGFFEGAGVPPFGDFGVVAAEQDVGDAPAAVLDGAGIVGEFEEAGGVAVVCGAVVVAEDAGEEAGDGVGDDGGGESAVGEDVVADGELAVDEVVNDALVHAFVVAAEEDEMGDFD